MELITTPEMLRNFNKRNQEFWSKRNKLLEEKMEYSEAACCLLEAEMQLPFGLQRRFDVLLEIAERLSTPLHRAFSRKAAKAKKINALTELIVEIVQKHPHITEPELLCQLKRREGVYPIQEMNDEEIILETGGKPIPISGLKDRLSRVKNKVG